MKSIHFSIAKDTAWREAQKISEYVGAKLISDVDIYDSIALTTEDMDTLDRFFREACTVVDDTFRELQPVHSLSEMGDNAQDYNVMFTIANAYDDRLNTAVQQVLESFFAYFLAAKWLKYSNQQEADKYSTEAEGYLDTARSLLYSRRRIQRPAPEEV